MAKKVGNLTIFGTVFQGDVSVIFSFREDPLHGLLDEISIYNRALDASEINAIYKAGALGKRKPIIPEPLRQVPKPEYVGLAMVAGATLTVGLTAMTGVSFIAQSLDKAFSQITTPDWLKRFLKLYSERTFKALTNSKRTPLKEGKRHPLRLIGSVIISTIALLAVFVYVEVNGLPNFLKTEYLSTAIPQVLISVVLVFLLSQTLSLIGAKVLGIWSEFRIWLHGLAALLLTGFIFKAPFASPSKVEYPSDLSQRKTGLIAASNILCILASATPFSIFHAMGLGLIGDTGLMMAAMTAFYSALPFRPLGGESIFKYHKGLWGAIFLAGMFLFLSVVFDLLPHIAYLISGLLATCIFVGLILIFKKVAKEPEETRSSC